MTQSREAQAKRAADEFRQKHRLEMQPLGDLAALIEQTTGHDVAVLDADPDEHGLTMRDPARNRVFIGVARTPHPMRQRSSLAHELGHLIFGDSADDLSEASSEEVRANAFARHLLLPREGLVAFLKNYEHVDESTLSEVVQRFLVSPHIAAIVMRDAGYITAAVANEWKKIFTPTLATKYGWRDHYALLQADSLQLRAPQQLMARAIAGYSEGVVSAQTIATLRSTSVDAVVAELEEAQIFPKELNPAEFELDTIPSVNIDLSGLEDSAGAS